MSNIYRLFVATRWYKWEYSAFSRIVIERTIRIKRINSFLLNSLHRYFSITWVVVTNEYNVTSKVLDFYVTCRSNVAINALMKNLQQCMTSRFIDYHLPPSINIVTCHYWRISYEFPSSILSKENRNGHSRESR